jgi:biopolymer transport protein ExbB/TolQ
MRFQIRNKLKDVEDLTLLRSAKKYTNIPILSSVIICIIGGTATLLIGYACKRTLPQLFAMLLERGPLQFCTIFAFWFTAGMLILKYNKLRTERSAFELEFIKEFTGGKEVIGTKTFMGEHAAIEENLNPLQRNLILVNRINKAIKQVRISNNPAEVANVLRIVAEADDCIIDSSSILIRYMIWAIPILGFIGTIQGMTQAIGSFDTVLKGASQVGFAGVQANLGLVTGGLSVAFETTFLALVLSAIANLFFSSIQKQEEDLLSDIEDFTIENIINKYTTIKESVKRLVVSEGKEEIGEDVLIELKNMNRQNQVNTDELLAQLGRLIEAVDKMQQQNESTKSTASADIMPVLDELLNTLRVQAKFVEQMALIGGHLEKNAKAVEQLPDAIQELRDTSHKLGELFSKIYNRSFV